MMQKVNRIIELLKNYIPFKYNNIISILKLGGMSNNNFLVKTDNGNLFLRLEKSLHSDKGYGGKFYKEEKISKILSGFNIVPEIYFRGKIEDKGVIIEEYISKSEKDYSDSIVADSIKKIHNVSVNNIDFLEEYDTVAGYEYKYKSRIKDDSELKDYYLSIKNLIKKHKNIVGNCNFKICHADLRKDNIIIKENVCYIVDWEGALISDESVDIAGYYMGNLFFENNNIKKDFDIEDLNNWIDYFSKDEKFIKKIYLISILQFFSDLSWLENYLRINKDKKLENLFIKNKNTFSKIYNTLSELIK